MKLSVIIPVYKVEAYLDQCLGSVFDTTAGPDDFEVVLVNDGTPDNSMIIARRYAEEHPNMHILEQENQGLSTARMNGLTQTKGEYVWFVDSDDYLLQGGLDMVLSLLNRPCCEDLLVSPLLWSYPSENENHLDISPDVPRTGTGKYFLQKQLFYCWAAPRYIIKKTLFQSGSLFFPKGLLHEDEYFGRVLLYSVQNIRILDSSVYVYRQRPVSIMSSLSIRTSYDIVAIYKHLSFFCDSSVNDSDKPWFRSQIIGFLLESYTKNQGLYGSRDFRIFRRDKQAYILQEYKKYCPVFNKKRVLMDMILIHMPKIHKELVKLLSRRNSER